jgi:hypothetical protein
MKPLAYALVADGTSDRALLPVVRWALRRAVPGGAFATPVLVVHRSRPVVESVARAREDYRPDLIFVHRDAEHETHERRRREIPIDGDLVPVIPVRMTEAWLLIDEGALRAAAGNPRGTVPVDIPPAGRLESIADPKRLLKELLARASALKGRHLARFDREERVQRLAELIVDYSPHFALPAFRAFWEDLHEALQVIGVVNAP